MDVKEVSRINNEGQVSPLQLGDTMWEKEGDLEREEWPFSLPPCHWKREAAHITENFLQTLVGRKIVKFRSCDGTYGMGGLGWFSIIFEGNKDYPPIRLTYTLWSAEDWLTIDGLPARGHELVKYSYPAIKVSIVVTNIEITENKIHIEGEYITPKAGERFILEGTDVRITNIREGINNDWNDQFKDNYKPSQMIKAWRLSNTESTLWV